MVMFPKPPKRERKPRRAIRSQSARHRAQQRGLKKLSEALRRRSRGGCEARGFSLGCTARGAVAHHVLRRSQGGEHTLENLLWVCRPCHDQIHAYPNAARDLGLLRQPWEAA